MIREEALQPPAAETSFELPVVIPPAPPPIWTWSPEEYNSEDYEREVSMSVFDAENQFWKLQFHVIVPFKNYSIVDLCYIWAKSSVLCVSLFVNLTGLHFN